MKYLALHIGRTYVDDSFCATVNMTAQPIRIPIDKTPKVLHFSAIYLENPQLIVGIQMANTNHVQTVLLNNFQESIRERR